MSLMIHVIDRCYQTAFMRENYSLVHWDREQCEKGGIEAINKTGLDYFTVYFCQSGVYPHSSVHLNPSR